MPAVLAHVNGSINRRRKAHLKSRKGCGNCKLRRIKCDEHRPTCRKCLSYGVSCDYDGKQPSLDLSAQGSFQVDFSGSSAAPCKEKPIDFRTASLRSPVSINATITSAANNSLCTGTLDADTSKSYTGTVPLWSFTESDLEILKRFQDRTVMSLGTRRTAPIYRNCISQLAFTYPFLMHMILSLTLLHDAHLCYPRSPDTALQYEHASLGHWNTATKLFNSILSQPIPPSDRDAIWATGALLGTTGFAYLETHQAEEAWPLKQSDPCDLHWLKLSEGKKAIWQIADPTRPDSIFYGLSKQHSHLATPEWIRQNDTSLIPEQLKRLFEITPQSDSKNNVYHLPALTLSHLSQVKLTHDNVLEFLYFMGYMTPEFRRLLEIKDPRALLLLAWWFGMLEEGEGEAWWLARRARVEGKAIRLWLQRWYGGEEGLVELFGNMGAAGAPLGVSGAVVEVMEGMQMMLGLQCNGRKERGSCSVQ